MISNYKWACYASTKLFIVFFVTAMGAQGFFVYAEGKTMGSPQIEGAFIEQPLCDVLCVDCCSKQAAIKKLFGYLHVHNRVHDLVNAALQPQSELYENLRENIASLSQENRFDEFIERLRMKLLSPAAQQELLHECEQEVMTYLDAASLTALVGFAQHYDLNQFVDFKKAFGDSGAEELLNHILAVYKNYGRRNKNTVLSASSLPMSTHEQAARIFLQRFLTFRKEQNPLLFGILEVEEVVQGVLPTCMAHIDEHTLGGLTTFMNTPQGRDVVEAYSAIEKGIGICVEKWYAAKISGVLQEILNEYGNESWARFFVQRAFRIVYDVTRFVKTRAQGLQERFIDEGVRPLCGYIQLYNLRSFVSNNQSLFGKLMEAGKVVVTRCTQALKVQPQFATLKGCVKEQVPGEIFTVLESFEGNHDGGAAVVSQAELDERKPLVEALLSNTNFIRLKTLLILVISDMLPWYQGKIKDIERATVATIKDVLVTLLNTQDLKTLNEFFKSDACQTILKNYKRFIKIFLMNLGNEGRETLRDLVPWRLLI